MVVTPLVLRAAGIKYFAEATNIDRGLIVLIGKWNEKSPFWREGPDGGKVLMAHTRQYSQLWFVCDLPPGAGNCRQGLPAFLQQFWAPEYKPDAVLMYGSQLENTDARLSEPEFVATRNAAYAYPKIHSEHVPGLFPVHRAALWFAACHGVGRRGALLGRWRGIRRERTRRSIVTADLARCPRKRWQRYREY